VSSNEKNRKKQYNVTKYKLDTERTLQKKGAPARRFPLTAEIATELET
jgi:hypothetical protein